MQSVIPKSRKAKCAGWWYPASRTAHDFSDNPIATAVISPHAGFEFSGLVSMQAVSYVKKNRVWIFGTSHYERIKKGISIFNGEYRSSVGKTETPEIKSDELEVLKRYFSHEGHRTEEHSIENVLYCLNHFTAVVKGFCVLVQVSGKDQFDAIADDMASLWKPGDSMIVSTDWNHFVDIDVIDRLMDQSAKLLADGDIETLYDECSHGRLEACGIDALYLAAKILTNVGEIVRFKVLKSTDSSRVTGRKHGDKCVGYISARNSIS